MRRHDHLHEVFGDAVAALTFDKYFVDIAVIKIADRAFDQIAFLIDLRWCNRFQGKLTDLLPHALQVFIVALDLCFRALGTRRAHDKARALWHFDLLRDLFELLAIWCVRNLAGDATATCSVWHQNAITTRERQVSRESSTLVAALFFNNLNQQNLANFDNFLDFIATCTWFAHRTNVLAIIFISNRFDAVVFFRCGRFIVILIIIAVRISVIRDIRCLNRCFLHALHRGRRFFIRNFNFVIIVQIDGFHTFNLGRCLCIIHRGFRSFGFARTRPRTALWLLVFIVLGGLRFGIGTLFGQQRLTVCNWNLIIIRVDFREREETMAITAIVHKSRLQGRLNARHFCKIYIAS